MIDPKAQGIATSALKRAFGATIFTTPSAPGSIVYALEGNVGVLNLTGVRTYRDIWGRISLSVWAATKYKPDQFARNLQPKAGVAH